MANVKRFRTSKALRAAAEEYFGSISRTVDVTEMVPTGNLDDKGHMIMKAQAVVNDRGEVIRAREYLIPPTVVGLCLHLGIHRSTWARWCDHQAHPELEEATEWVNSILRLWNEEQLLTRGDKGVKGIMFNLQNNYGYTQKVEVEAGPQTREAKMLTTQEKLALLQELWEAGSPMEEETGERP